MSWIVIYKVLDLPPQISAELASLTLGQPINEKPCILASPYAGTFLCNWYPKNQLPIHSSEFLTIPFKASYQLTVVRHIASCLDVYKLINASWSDGCLFWIQQTFGWNIWSSFQFMVVTSSLTSRHLSNRTGYTLERTRSHMKPGSWRPSYSSSCDTSTASTIYIHRTDWQNVSAPKYRSNEDNQLEIKISVTYHW